jgi:hypothetical protein
MTDRLERLPYQALAAGSTLCLTNDRALLYDDSVYKAARKHEDLRVHLKEFIVSHDSPRH